ncbi:acetoacetate-CoA ligase [Sistotremastrum niveocremeum HHB9708]|uniref:Acetoacetate-CoA ligase n=1 Tax=Sistotremastrum niveocremeum HHB9708 TaxID=1314777 RepID=A0A165A7X2_9AGAM|nr:acetoacetate-CoA ligase [Sistotremastrum niveocremeum HHB9708]
MATQWTVPKQIWKHPNPSHSRPEQFRRFVNHKHGLNLKDYHELHNYSISDWTFWKDLWDYLGIISSVPPTKVIIEAPLIESPEFFPGSRLNYAENILIRNDDSVSCTVARESGHFSQYTSREIREKVRRMANAMRANGLKVGDRVAAVVTNSIDAIVIAMAAASIGAIYSSTATDMGAQGVLDRYKQIKPKFVFAETEVIYAGKLVDLTPKISHVVEELKHHGVDHVILLPSTVTGKDLKIKSDFKTLTLAQFLSTGKDVPLVFEQLPFNHPLIILYSSGTSGPPKCIVHSAGGILMQTKKDVALGLDMWWGDTYFQYTSCAWMMWNAMLGGLAVGGRLILYDGSPFHPDIKQFLKFVSDQKVTHFGTSPRFVGEIQGRGIKPLELGSFEALRMFFVTGAVVTPPVYEWAASVLPPTTHVMSATGGTDICSTFVGACTSMPAYAGEFQVKVLGMKTEVYDYDGKVIDDTGRKGELVCSRAHPSIPLGFWGDVGRKKFFDAYFARFPGVWTHGDFIAINPTTKGLLIFGRSDGVLNPSGIRFGSAEIYAVIDKYTAIIEDTICIGQRRPQDKDERVLLFVKMRDSKILTEALKADIRESIKQALSARHVPAYIFQVEEIPLTVNNKKIEIAVKQIVSGATMKPSGTVANPESLQLYYKYFELEKLLAAEKEKTKAKL